MIRRPLARRGKNKNRSNTDYSVRRACFDRGREKEIHGAMTCVAR
jgi:hypothetical protein